MTEVARAAPLGGIPPSSPTLWTYLNGRVLLRAMLVALLLGSALTLANQSDAFFGSDGIRRLPLVLVYVTPFVVVSISQVLGAREAVLDARMGTAGETAAETFLSTALSHGIPLRAGLVGLMAASVNTAIVMMASLIEHGNIGPLPLPLLGQAFSLPLLFGVLSQALAYRRAMRAFSPARPNPRP